MRRRSWLRLSSRRRRHPHRRRVLSPSPRTPVACRHPPRRPANSFRAAATATPASPRPTKNDEQPLRPVVLLHLQPEQQPERPAPVSRLGRPEGLRGTAAAGAIWCPDTVPAGLAVPGKITRPGGRPPACLAGWGADGDLLRTTPSGVVHEYPTPRVRPGPGVASGEYPERKSLEASPEAAASVCSCRKQTRCAVAESGGAKPQFSPSLLTPRPGAPSWRSDSLVPERTHVRLVPSSTSACPLGCPHL
ncbi:hypothetical protein Aros01_07148 [Streptosporangium roseum]